jgi:cell division protein FtsB
VRFRFKNQMIRVTLPEPTREELLAIISAQAAQIATLLAENAALKARINELERRQLLRRYDSTHRHRHRKDAW